LSISEPLKRQLINELLRLRKAAINNNGDLDASRVESLERLARLVEIAESTEEKSRPRRWPIAAVFLVTLAIVTILFFLRVSTTQIELNIKVSDLQLELARQQHITSEIAVTSLAITGLHIVKMPRARNAGEAVASGGERSWNAVRLSLPQDSSEQDRITVAALIAPEQSLVWLSRTDVPGEFQLAVKHKDMTVSANVGGKVEIATQDFTTRTLDFGRGRQILFRGGHNVIDVAFVPRPGSNVEFTGPLAVEKFNLQRAIENVMPGGPVSYSTILGGELYLLSVADRKYDLRTAETLRFESVVGEIRTLKSVKDHIELTFLGEVSGMTTGTGTNKRRGTNKRSIMPTYLEWLQAHHAWSLLWGTALYIFGLAAAVMRWWRTGA